jgi:hypothetical protein
VINWEIASGFDPVIRISSTYTRRNNEAEPCLQMKREVSEQEFTKLRERVSALIDDGTRLMEPVSGRRGLYIVYKYDWEIADEHSQEVGACKPFQISCRKGRRFVCQSDVSATDWRQHS